MAQKTQYILKMADNIRSVITDKPEEIYWNRGLQRLDDTPNIVSAFYVFMGTNSQTEDAIVEAGLAENAYPVVIEDFAELDLTAFRAALVQKADLELTDFEVYAKFHNIKENNPDHYYGEHGKLIMCLDICSY